MSSAIEKTIIFRDVLGKISTFSHKTWDVVLRFVDVHILEFEDVLFHHNSAVMMPENPKGKSSTDGGEASSDQITISGVKAIAIIFKQLEFDPKKRLLIAAHTDTSGEDQYNFKLSKLRAKNVFFLLVGERTSWASLCYEQHKIEDYQQILTYYRGRFLCDPDGIDDTWGTKTKNATEAFIENYNLDFVVTNPGTTPLPDGLIALIQSDSKKRWPVPLWEAVFNLYSNDLREVLYDPLVEFDANRAAMNGMFLYDNRKYVGCGESFPIADKEKKNYRSQKNRRVEVLFFDKEEALDIEVFKPCDQIKKKHTEKECPLWNKWHLHSLYVDPNDLYAVVYHLSFSYFDRVTNTVRNVPKGLHINAVENDNQPLVTDTRYDSDVYFVKVQFTKPLSDPYHQKLHFEFNAQDLWIFTESDAVTPVIVPKSKIDIDKLGFKDRLKYYDIPKKWSSRNYWTRDTGDTSKNGRFETVFNGTRKLKPLGQNKTAPTAPLNFSFDDVVLVANNRTQRIKDRDSSGANINLDANSRCTLFYIDDTASPAVYKEVTGYKDNKAKIKMYNQNPNEPVFSKNVFSENLITDIPGNLRLIYFCNGFYDVFDKRTSSADPGFSFADNCIDGARAAVLNDSDIHVMKQVRSNSASDLSNAYAQSNCGNYELHYLNYCYVFDDKPVSYLVIYWSCRLRANLGGTAADVSNHRKKGMTNAMQRLNKDYWIVKSDDAADKPFSIRPFHFMEAKNDTNGGPHQALVDVTDNTDGAWMLPTTAKLRARDYKSDPSYFGAGDPDNALADTDQQTYTVLTNHHEMGHATGNWDCYLYNYKAQWKGAGDKLEWQHVPSYDQPYTAKGGPYSSDILARMNMNRSPRLRDYWKFVCWLHDEGVAGKSLNKFLQQSSLKITSVAKDFTHNYQLSSEFKNVEKAARQKLNHAVGGSATCDLHLYRLGDEELSHFKNIGKMNLGFESTQVFKGILVVKTVFAIKFVDAAAPEIWGFNSAHDWADDLNKTMKAMLNGKYKIQTNTAANDFSNNYVMFVPHFNVYTGAPPGDSHIDIEVTFQRGNNFDVSGKLIEVDWDTNKNRIIRYCFGKNTGIGSLGLTDFNSIVAWVSSPLVANDVFTMKAL